MKSRTPDVVPGTEGYEQFAEQFIKSSQALKFEQVHGKFLPYLPAAPARVLDLAAGAGQNAAALAGLGHNVTAVEPLAALLDAAKTTYAGQSVSWLQGSLPSLDCLAGKESSFDFILLAAVWHHLDEAEQDAALRRVVQLLSQGGRLAMTLRNGPAGVGSRVFETCADSTVELARNLGLRCMLDLRGQKSFMSGKEEVTWGWLVFEGGITVNGLDELCP